VELNVLNLETIGRTKDEGKKNFERPSVWEKVNKIEVSKARGEEDGLQKSIQHVSPSVTFPLCRNTLNLCHILKFMTSL
jgi:hypothetical protein